MTPLEEDVARFIKKASGLLAESEASLQALTQETSVYLESLSQPQANGNNSPISNLQYLHQQASYLSGQNHTLKKYLDSNCQELPSNQPLSRTQILQRQEEERTRIAKEIENSIGQLLANAIFELASIKRLMDTQGDKQELMGGINALQTELEQGLTDLRFLIADLEPNSTLGSFGLFAGLRRYLEKFSTQTGIKTVYQTNVVIEQLPSTIELAIFRIIQEALQNIRQHAKATQVQVTVTEDESCLVFSIKDDGIGLQYPTTNQIERHLGLVSMKDLADLLEGELKLMSDHKNGTQVILTVPYPQL